MVAKQIRKPALHNAGCSLMVASLELDLIKPTTHPMFRFTWGGVLALIIGIGLFGFAWLSYFDLYTKQIIVNEQLQTLQQAEQEDERVSSTHMRSQIKPDQIMAIRSSVYEIFIPWNDLFDALEDSNIKNVVLLGLQPDSNKRQVVITGEANNYLSVIAYVDQLARQPVFSEVYLKKHAVKETDIDKPVSFSIFARWSIIGKEPVI